MKISIPLAIFFTMCLWTKRGAFLFYAVWNFKSLKPGSIGFKLISFFVSISTLFKCFNYGIFSALSTYYLRTG